MACIRAFMILHLLSFILCLCVYYISLEYAGCSQTVQTNLCFIGHLARYKNMEIHSKRERERERHEKFPLEHTCKHYLCWQHWNCFRFVYTHTHTHPKTKEQKHKQNNSKREEKKHINNRRLENESGVLHAGKRISSAQNHSTLLSYFDFITCLYLFA